MSREHEFDFDLEQRRVALVLDEELYPLDAIYGAAYLFIDRCYVFLERPAERRVRVLLRSRRERPSEAELEALAGEFANELLNQALRQRIGTATRRIREYTMARAFLSDPDRAGIEALLAELDAEELEEDDLEIAVPWEESGRQERDEH